jgi:hypothetical protein
VDAVALGVTVMAYNTISLQPPWHSSIAKTTLGEDTQGCSQRQQKICKLTHIVRPLRAHVPSFECRSREESTMDHMR